MSGRDLEAMFDAPLVNYMSLYEVAAIPVRSRGPKVRAYGPLGGELTGPARESVD
jgi:hypothetical protein